MERQVQTGMSFPLLAAPLLVRIEQNISVPPTVQPTFEDFCAHFGPTMLHFLVSDAGHYTHPSVQPEPSSSGSAASGSGFFNNSNTDAQGSLYMQDAGDARGGRHHHDVPLGGSPTARILTSSAVEGEDGVHCIPEDWESQLAAPETASEWWPWSM